MAHRSPASTLWRAVAALPVLAGLLAPPAADAASLQPTHMALVRQAQGAREAKLRFLADDRQVHEAVRHGELVPLRGNANYHIHRDVRHAAARPEVKVFVERLSQQYRASCGEKLVVTSLVRPKARQPWNSDPLSVHPTGMALDLRIPAASRCRSWLESTLLDLEDEGLVEAARERVVPHYHVVVFPFRYATFLAKSGVDVPAPKPPQTMPGTALAVLASADAVDPFLVPSVLGLQQMASAASTIAPAVSRTSSASPTTKKASTSSRSTAAKKRVTRASTTRYKVRRGDNLWTIAKRHGVSVASIKRANSRLPRTLKPGHVLTLPAKR